MIPDQAELTLYHTTFAATAKIRSDTKNIKHILSTKKIQYEDVDLSEQPFRRRDMLAGSDNSFALPQLHVNGQFIGTVDDIQEFEDFGELDQILQGVSPADVLAADALAAEAAAAAFIAAQEAQEPEGEGDVEEQEEAGAQDEDAGVVAVAAAAAVAVGGAAAIAGSTEAAGEAVPTVDGGDASEAEATAVDPTEAPEEQEELEAPPTAAELEEKVEEEGEGAVEAAQEERQQEADDAFDTASEGESQESLVAPPLVAAHSVQQGSQQQLAAPPAEEEEHLTAVLEPQEVSVAFAETEDGGKVAVTLEQRRLSPALESPRNLAVELPPVVPAVEELVVASADPQSVAVVALKINQKEAADADVDEQVVAASEVAAPEESSFQVAEEAEVSTEAAPVVISRSPTPEDAPEEVQVPSQTADPAAPAAAAEQTALPEPESAAEVATTVTPTRLPELNLEQALSGVADSPEKELSKYYTAVEEVLPQQPKPQREAAVDHPEAAETVRKLRWSPRRWGWKTRQQKK